MNWKAYKESNILKLTEVDMAELLSLNTYFNRKIDGFHFKKKYFSSGWDGKIIHFLDDKFLHLGLWGELYKLSNKVGLPLSINGLKSIFDIEITYDEFKQWALKLFEPHDKITPYEYQIDSAYKVLKYKYCLQELATGAGKTLIFYLIFMWLLKHKKGRILLVVPNIDLATQPIEEFDDYSCGRFPYIISNEFSGAERIKDADLVFGTYQTLVKKPASWFKQFNVMAIDETHKAKAKSIKDILKNCVHCEYRFGKTGTLPEETGVDYLTIQAYLGPVVKKITTTDIISTDKATPVDIKIIKFIHNNNQLSKNLYLANLAGYSKDVYELEKKYIQQDKKRLKTATKIITSLKGASLVAFHHKEYGQKIFNSLKEENPTGRQIYYIDGDIPSKNRNAILDNVRSDNEAILVGSFGTISTGLNIKNLINLHLLESFKSPVIIRQTIGRMIRKHESKDMVYVYDYVDDLSYKYLNEETKRMNTWKNKLFKHGLERQKIYKKENFPFTVIKYKINK